MNKKMIGLFFVLMTGIMFSTGVPSLVATCYFSTTTANYIVSVINAWGTASFAISLILAVTGGGASIGSLIVAIAAFIRKNGSAKAVSW